MARVQLDGGEGSLTGGSSGISHGGSDSWGSNYGGSGNCGSSDSRGSDSRGSDSGVVQSRDSGKVESSSVGVGKGGDGGGGDNGLLVSITPLPLSSGEESQVLGLSSSNLGGVLDWLGGDSGEN